jgi:hypothetical protein
LRVAVDAPRLLCVALVFLTAVVITIHLFFFIMPDSKYFGMR